jgi:biopolymer transport protein ExbD
MNFRRGRTSDVPEINLIPFIDVLLVIIIFLMLTTTYAKFSGLEINLPTADASKQNEQPNEVSVSVTQSGQVLVNKAPLAAVSVQAISDALRRAAGEAKDPVIVINADAKATHQSVVDIMQAAQAAGYPRISFATAIAPLMAAGGIAGSLSRRWYERRLTPSPVATAAPFVALRRACRAAARVVPLRGAAGTAPAGAGDRRRQSYCGWQRQDAAGAVVGRASARSRLATGHHQSRPWWQRRGRARGRRGHATFPGWR